MGQELYDYIMERYNKADYPKVLGEPGHFFFIAVMSVWKERDYPADFKVGNSELSEKCGVASPNIPKLRERVFKECTLDNKAIWTYKSAGRSRPGTYKVNSIIVPEVNEVNIEEEIKVEETAREVKKKAWKTIPFQNKPSLAEGGGISQNQLEKLDSFGLRFLRQLDKRYYTPSSQDTELLYELFRYKTPQQVLELAKQAQKANIDNALAWMGEGAKVG